MKLCSMQRPLQRLHLIAGLAHIVSGTALLIAGGKAVDWQWNKYAHEITNSFALPSSWQFCCYSGGAYTTGTQACPNESRQFYLAHPPGHKSSFKINTLAMACAFAFVSGAVHLLSALSKPSTMNCTPLALLDWTWKGETRRRFVLDYAVSAPIMMSLFGALWGANNLWSVICAPILLSALLITSTVVLLNENVEKKHRWRLVACHIIVYLGLLGVGVVHSLIANAKSPAEDSNRGRTPNAVIYVSLFVLLTFSSFIVPYCLELKNRPKGMLAVSLDVYQNKAFVTEYTLAYVALSLIAKVTLHAMFGITVINHARVLSRLSCAEMTKKPVDMAEDNAAVLAAGFSVIVGGIVLYVFTRRWLKNAQ